MATVVEDFRGTQAGIVRLAERELTSFWASLNPEEPLAVVNALENFLPDLIISYGEMGAAAAADFYEELREESPQTRKAYRAVLANSVPLEQALISTKWAVGPLFRAEADALAALSNLTDVTDRLVKKQARDTVVANTSRDPERARWARVPSGSETCSFCLMLASRGAVYTSLESASNTHKYHGKCDCVPTPVWSDYDLDRLKADNGYDPDEYYDRWQDALESKKDKG